MANIVIIEDEQDIATLVATKLRNAGHNVEVATDGAAGLERTMELKPDVVVLDVMLPTIDGFTICETIRTELGGESAPIIVLLSARSQIADRQRGVEAGCDAYIVKPFRPADLLAEVAELLERRGDHE